MSHPREWPLESYCLLLEHWAGQFRLDRRLRLRFDKSDLVQETLLRAHANETAFQGTTEAEWIGWLKEILTRTLIDEVRKARAGKRDVAREQSLQELLASPSAPLEALQTFREPAPSQRAEQLELRTHLARAVERLPEDQREVVVRRDLKQEPLAAIAGRLNRTSKSVSCLLFRGRRQLRRWLANLQ
jgi:RNA polymerase sigma-70 factor (ECF subfamily)